MTAEERELEKNLNVMASWLLWSAFENWTEQHGWEDMPDVGEYDHDRIIDTAQLLLPPDVTPDRYKSALRYLAQRAEKAVT